MRVRAIVILMLGMLIGLVAYCATDDMLPAQDKIPIVRYMIPEAFVSYTPLSNAGELSEESLSGLPVWEQKRADGISVNVLHQAALSSSTMEEYVKASVAAYEACDTQVKTVYGNIQGCSKVKIDVHDTLATLEIDEVVIANGRWHIYQRILRTPEGYAVATGRCQSKDWAAKSNEIKLCVDKVRLLAEMERKLIDGSSVVCIDADGDLFVKTVSWYDAATNKRTSSRNYYRNPDKNKLDEFKCVEVETAEYGKHPLAGESSKCIRVEKLFGYELGAFLTDRSKARKTEEGSLIVELPLKASAPYDVYNSIALYYTKNDALLYRIKLSSGLKKQTMPNKSDILRSIAESVEKKFKDILEMKEDGDFYSSVYHNECGQKILVKMVEDSIVSKKTNKIITGFRFVMDIEDTDLLTNGIAAGRFKTCGKRNTTTVGCGPVVGYEWQEQPKDKIGTIDSFCGFKFWSKRETKPVSKPVPLSLGFSYVKPQQVAKVTLGKPFRKFKDALLRYDQNEALKTIELFRVMPDKTSLTTVEQEIDSVAAVVERKYGMKLKNLDTIMHSTTSSLILPGYTRKTVAWRELVRDEVFVSCHADVWVKQLPEVYQGQKPRSVQYYVLTLRAHQMGVSTARKAKVEVGAKDLNRL